MIYDKSNIVFHTIPNNSRFINLSGQSFERLTVLGYAGKHGSHQQWWCECKCGTIKAIRSGHLRDGSTRSCKCWGMERQKAIVTTHGKEGTPVYRAYHGAKARCSNPHNASYSHYGARGIEFRFDSFEDFYAEVGDRPNNKYSIGRIDNNGHYEQGNIQWETIKPQNRNKTNNVEFVVNGVGKIAAEWAEEINSLNANVIFQRRRNGWCDPCAVLIPVRGGRCSHLNS